MVASDAIQLPVTASIFVRLAAEHRIASGMARHSTCEWPFANFEVNPVGQA